MTDDKDVEAIEQFLYLAVENLRAKGYFLGDIYSAFANIVDDNADMIWPETSE